MTTLRRRIAASFDAQPLMATLGAQLMHVAPGEVHILLPFDARLTQQHGYTHAGAITSVLDSACGYAALTRAPEDHGVLTVEFKVNFLRPALGKEFLAVGKVRTAGRTLIVCNGEVRAESEDPPALIALMQATIMHFAEAAPGQR